MGTQSKYFIFSVGFKLICSIFFSVGWLALGLAEEVEKEEPEVSKRQAGRGSTLVYGAAPSQYSVPSHQTPHQTPQTQVKYTTYYKIFRSFSNNYIFIFLYILQN